MKTNYNNMSKQDRVDLDNALRIKLSKINDKINYFKHLKWELDPGEDKNWSSIRGINEILNDLEEDYLKTLDELIELNRVRD